MFNVYLGKLLKSNFWSFHCLVVIENFVCEKADTSKYNWFLSLMNPFQHVFSVLLRIDWTISVVTRFFHNFQFTFFIVSLDQLGESDLSTSVAEWNLSILREINAQTVSGDERKEMKLRNKNANREIQAQNMEPQIN